ncbi:hypothetical protein LIER_43925 [Lithospermum erythrorhizon]|uniref:Uncharacterized protein n=1 Tax=Lithospermum erythrorhizon TaxID=34254 RepID=A0AAV3RB68_LITER
MWGKESGAPVAVEGGRLTWVGNNLLDNFGIGGDGGGYSNESDHDLAAMVSEFLEVGSAEVSESLSYSSSDSDSCFSDLAFLANEISVSFVELSIFCRFKHILRLFWFEFAYVDIVLLP